MKPPGAPYCGVSRRKPTRGAKQSGVVSMTDETAAGRRAASTALDALCAARPLVPPHRRTGRAT